MYEIRDILNGKQKVPPTVPDLKVQEHSDTINYENVL